MMRSDIAEVARRSGLPASTLRFYEEKGLIALHRAARPASACSMPACWSGWR